MIVARTHAGLDVRQRGCMAGEIRLLRQIPHGRTRLNEAAALVRLDDAGNYF